MRKLSIFTLDWPLRQATLFPRSQPLIVEIGFGNGDYLLHLARMRPDCNVIGLEISGQSLAKAEAKVEKSGLSNVRPIHCRAETALWHLLEPQSVQRIPHQLPRSLVQEAARTAAAHPARHGRAADESAGCRCGLLLLATDIRAYAEMAHAILSSAPGLQNEYAAPWLHEVAGRLPHQIRRKGLS